MVYFHFNFNDKAHGCAEEKKLVRDILLAKLSQKVMSHMCPQMCPIHAITLT